MLYTGMRTRHCRLIAEKRCLTVEPIYLDFVEAQVILGERSNPRQVIRRDSALDAFARFDGFGAWADLYAFWGSLLDFDGWHIRWQEFPQ